MPGWPHPLGLARRLLAVSVLAPALLAPALHAPALLAPALLAPALHAPALLAPALLASEASVLGAPPPHDLHLAYGDLAIEGSLIAGRIRFFKDDLERALAPRDGNDTFRLEPGAEADALVMRYVRENLRIRVDGQELEASLVGSGEDELDLEPVWWVIVQYQAASPTTELEVRNTLLFDVYDDQRNVFKFVHFPEEKQRTFYFAEGEEEHIVRF